MKKIFISYSRSDKKSAKELSDDLILLGHSVWFDQHLEGGQVWWDKIIENIMDTDFFIFILTPSSILSLPCKKELQYAVDLGKTIIPIRISKEEISMNLLSPKLSKLQIVDYINKDKDSVLKIAKIFFERTPSKTLPVNPPTPPEIPVSYLGGIAEKVNFSDNMSYEMQSSLLIDLKKSLSEPSIKKDAYQLLNIFRKRRDIFATIAEEIDELITLSDNEMNIKTSTKVNQQFFMKNKLTAIISIVIIILLIIGGQHLIQNYLYNGTDNQDTKISQADKDKSSESNIKEDRYLILKIQVVLKEKQLYDGKIDNIFGPKSIIGLKQYQKLNNFTPTGELDIATYKRIKLDFISVQDKINKEIKRVNFISTKKMYSQNNVEKNYDDKIYSSNKDTIELNQLDEFKPITQALLTVHSNVYSANVYIDENKYGSTPHLNIRLPLGEHNVKVVKEGYSPFIKQFNLQKPKTLIAQLKEKPGNLSIITKPNDALIFLNDAKKGQSPLEIILQSGKYKIEVSKKGYKTHQEKITIKADQKIEKEITLELAPTFLSSVDSNVDVNKKQTKSITKEKCALRVSKAYPHLVWENIDPTNSYQLYINQKKCKKIIPESSDLMITYNLLNDQELINEGVNNYQIEVVRDKYRNIISRSRKLSCFNWVSGKEWDKILDQAKVINEIDPNNSLLLGHFYEEEGFTVAAMYFYRKFFKNNPEEIGMRVFLIKVYSDLRLKTLKTKEIEIYQGFPE